MGGKVRRRWEGREGVLGRGEIRGKTLLYGEVVGRKTTKIRGKHDALRAWGEWGAELKGDSVCSPDESSPFPVFRHCVALPVIQPDSF